MGKKQLYEYFKRKQAKFNTKKLGHGEERELDE